MIEENNPILMEPDFSNQETTKWKNFYDVLEVDPFDPREKIREAYMRMKNAYSLNSQALYSVVSDEEANFFLKNIEEAYKTLDDEQLRKKYDEEYQAQNQLENDPFSGNKDNIIPTERNMFAATQETQTPNNPSRFAKRAFIPEVQKKISEFLGSEDTGSGALAKKIREYCCVDLIEITERTKISLEYVVAIENNDFKKLPALVYIKGFLKSYLSYLGVRENVNLVDAYAERFLQWQSEKKF